MAGTRCMDCKRDTGSRDLGEYPLMLRDEVWRSITAETHGAGVLCREDMERRLGRPLTDGDLLHPTISHDEARIRAWEEANRHERNGYVKDLGLILRILDEERASQADLQRTFDLMWDADQRAIRAWEDAFSELLRANTAEVERRRESETERDQLRSTLDRIYKTVAPRSAVFLSGPSARLNGSYCPDHPLHTYQKPDQSRFCTHPGCTWSAPAPHAAEQLAPSHAP